MGHVSESKLSVGRGGRVIALLLLSASTVVGLVNPSRAQFEFVPQPTAPVPLDTGTITRATNPPKVGLEVGIIPDLNGDDEDSAAIAFDPTVGSDVFTAALGMGALAPEALAELNTTNATASYSYMLSMAPTSAGGTSMSAMCFTDSAACAAVSQVINHAIPISTDRRALEASEGESSTVQALFKRAMAKCVREKLGAGGVTLAEASNSCRETVDLPGLLDHPAAATSGAGGGGIFGGGAGNDELRLSTLMFKRGKDDAISQSFAGVQYIGRTDSLTQNFELTAQEFQQKFGDVVFISKPQENAKAVDHYLKKLTPWEATGEDEGSWEDRLRDPVQLDNVCAAPVSLEVSRYCWARYYYQLIQWMIVAQCNYYNSVYTSADAHLLPMTPRGDQIGGENCNGLNLSGADAGTCPGPWEVLAKDWDRARTDLSIPGYAVGRGTAEAFFFAYRREVAQGEDFFGSLISGLLSSIPLVGGVVPTLSCSGADMNGPYEFTRVARDWGRQRFPTWAATAMRFANSRALLFTRDIVTTAWTTIQQFSASAEYKDMAELGRQLLQAQYSERNEAQIQHELELLGDMLRKLELEAKLARTNQSSS